jgi:hypothetical protein
LFSTSKKEMNILLGQMSKFKFDNKKVSTNKLLHFQRPPAKGGHFQRPRANYANSW